MLTMWHSHLIQLPTPLLSEQIAASPMWLFQCVIRLGLSCSQESTKSIQGKDGKGRKGTGPALVTCVCSLSSYYHYIVVKEWHNISQGISSYCIKVIQCVNMKSPIGSYFIASKKALFMAVLFMVWTMFHVLLYRMD